MPRREALPATLALAVCLALILASVEYATAATTPPGFKDSLVTSVPSPTALAFTPDGRMLITTQPGQLRVYEGGTLLSKPALALGSRVCTNSGERGLLGIAVDPNFAANRYIYIYYTFNGSGGCSNRVERYTLSDGNAARFSKVLIKKIPSTAGNHNAGDLHFGHDGYLYVSVGDGGCDYANPSNCQYNNDASRDRHVLLGKILRVTRNGGVPSTNPFQGTNSARCNLSGRTEPGKNCRETFAMGLRNPFRMAFDPDATGTRFFINDVGGGAWEEIDVGKRGADYAWNLCEGRHDNPSRAGSVDCTNPPYTPPIHEYSHDDTGCSSITGGAFVPDGIWPASYNRSYLYSDYVCGKIFRLTPRSGGGYAQSEFVTGLGERSAVAMAFGPAGGTQALYYTTYAGGGEIRRIAYTGT
jgi:glucose/arabinose dehydrogenase